MVVHQSCFERFDPFNCNLCRQDCFPTVIVGIKDDTIWVDVDAMVRFVLFLAGEPLAKNCQNQVRIDWMHGPIIVQGEYNSYGVAGLRNS